MTYKGYEIRAEAKLDVVVYFDDEGKPCNYENGAPSFYDMEYYGVKDHNITEYFGNIESVKLEIDRLTKGEE